MKIEGMKIEVFVTVNPVLPTEREFNCRVLINSDEVARMRDGMETISMALIRELAPKLREAFALKGYEF